MAGYHDAAVRRGAGVEREIAKGIDSAACGGNAPAVGKIEAAGDVLRKLFRRLTNAPWLGYVGAGLRALGPNRRGL